MNCSFSRRDDAQRVSSSVFCSPDFTSLKHKRRRSLRFWVFLESGAASYAPSCVPKVAYKFDLQKPVSTGGLEITLPSRPLLEDNLLASYGRRPSSTKSVAVARLRWFQLKGPGGADWVEMITKIIPGWLNAFNPLTLIGCLPTSQRILQVICGTNT